MKLYVVRGKFNTNLEGMIFAVCTTYTKAIRAIQQISFGDSDEMEIKEIVADSVIIAGEIIAV